MYTKNKIAFIETPLQCFFLKNLYVNPNSIEIYIVKRKKWPNDINAFENYLLNYKTKTCNVFRVFIIFFLKKKKFNEIIIGSHLGLLNKSIIILSLILNYNVKVLDDGLYSIFNQKWMNFVSEFFKKLVWISYYNKNLKKKYIINYCITSAEQVYTFENACILVLTDLKGCNISENEEFEIINKITDFAKENEMKLYFFPHRRGRYELYKKMKLDISKFDDICFEDWYLKCKFKDNCRIFATGSSIWQVFENKKVNTTLIDLGVKKDNWIKDTKLVDQVLYLGNIKKKFNS